MKFVLAFSALAMFSVSAFSATIYVPDNYSTIQDAINASVNGDTVIVRPGTYDENINFLGRAVTVKSEEGTAVTVIDGLFGGSVVTFANREDEFSVLDGFTISNGNGTFQPYGPVGGGGIFCNYSSPTIINNTIYNNSAEDGGEIYCEAASPIIMGNRILANTATRGSGAGIHCEFSRPTITDNLISTNVADDGAGIGSDYFSIPTITDNRIISNTSNRRGGGILCYESDALITNNIIAENTAVDEGGGFWCFSSPIMSPIVTNNVIAENSAIDGGAIYCVGRSPAFLNNTIVANTATRGGGN